MPSLNALRKRIATVRSTQQITKAMKMVAAAKLRRAQEAAERARPYAAKLSEMFTAVVAGASGGPSAPRPATEATDRPPRPDQRPWPLRRLQRELLRFGGGPRCGSGRRRRRPSSSWDGSLEYYRRRSARVAAHRQGILSAATAAMAAELAQE